MSDEDKNKKQAEKELEETLHNNATDSSSFNETSESVSEVSVSVTDTDLSVSTRGNVISMQDIDSTNGPSAEFSEIISEDATEDSIVIDGETTVEAVPVSSVNGLTVPAEMTIFTGSNRLGKRMYVDETGKIVKEAGSQFVNQGITVEVKSIEELKQAQELAFQDNRTAFCYGTLLGVTSKESYSLTIKNNQSQDVYARTNENYEWPDMMVLMFDLDAFSEMTPDEQLQKFLDINPELDAVDHIIRASCSSNVIDTTKDEKPRVNGYHLYFFCKGEDIQNIVDLVWYRCWIAGFGRVVLSKSGAMLERSLFDKTVYQPSRLDFTGRVECVEPLVQSPIESVICRKEYRYLDFNRFEKLTESQIAEAKQIAAAQKQELKPEVTKRQKDFRNERLKTVPSKDRKQVNHILKKAQGECILEDNATLFVYLEDGLSEVKVSEILAAPQKFDGCRACDPLEPEYKDFSSCAIINLNTSSGQAYLHDFHSGLNFKLGTRAVVVADGKVIFDRYELPDGCFIENDCIFKYEDPESGKIKLICNAPIAVSKRIRQISDDTLLVDLVFKDNGLTRYVQVPRSTIAGKEITSLANYGINVNASNAQLLSGYLLEVERLNLKKSVREVTGLQTLGYAKINDDKYFLTGTEYVTKDGIYSVSSEANSNMPFEFNLPDPVLKFLLESVRRQGSRERWIEAAKKLNPFAYPKIMIAAAACSPLLEPLGVANFIIHLGYPSSSGKSSCLNIAASAVGDFNTLIETWNSTIVAIERRAYFLNSIPLFLDETKTITASNKNDLIREVIYMHSSGIAKGRGSKTGRQRVLRWHSVGFSTGEANLLAEVQDGGAKARVLDLPDMPFKTRSLETANLIDDIVSVMQDNFDHGMVEVMTYILRDGGNALYDCKDRLAALNEEIKSVLPPGVGIRLANIVAFILVSVEIVNRVLGLDWNTDDIKATLLDCARRQSTEDSEGNKALRYIYSFACANIGEACDAQGVCKVIGVGPGALEDQDWMKSYRYRIIKKSGSSIGILGPRSFLIIDNFIKEILRDAGFEPDSIFKEWRLKNYLESTGKGFVCQPKLFGMRPRVIAMNELAMRAVGHCTDEEPKSTEPESTQQSDNDPFVS